MATVYTIPTCGHCTSLKEGLRGYVDIKYVDCTSKKNAKACEGLNAFPVTVIAKTGEKCVGNDKAKIFKLLAS